MTMQKRRRGLAIEWSTANPILENGKFGFERDTGIIKVGNGVTPWNELPVAMSGIFAKLVGGLPMHLLSVASRTADTARLTITSFQKQETENGQNGGEVIWFNLGDPRAKAMLTWRLPIDKVNRVVRAVGATPVAPNEADMQRIVWAGAHHYAQDQVDYANPTDVHGHWSVEVPDTGLALRTRFGISYIGEDGKIGTAKTLVQTASADLVVDCSNDQVLRLRTGQGAEKAIEWANTQWGTASKRWRVRTTGTETGTGNAGSDFGIARYADAGINVVDEPIAITRSSGRVTIGGTAGSAGGATFNRNSSGQAVLVNTNYAGAAGATIVAATPYDAASRLIESKVTAEATGRFVVLADGKHEWGPGGSTARDVMLYRQQADVLKTDDAFKVMAVATGSRPSATTLGAGANIFDTSLNKPIWSNGSAWVDAAGNTV